MEVNINSEVVKADMQDLFGIFFEDLNHAADGGLYAELVRNRSFEFCPVDNPSYHGLTAWERIENNGRVNIHVEFGNGMFSRNPHYLVMEIQKAGTDAGIWNLGYNQGIPLQMGEVYNFTCHARKRSGNCERLNVSLRSAKGKVYESKGFEITECWEKYELTLVSPLDDWQSRLAITVEGDGSVELDFISLFPQHTYKNRKNGMRRDLAELLERMKPKFMRFPGGCLVHGGSLKAEDRDSMYRWKNTIGPVENRLSCRNNWGYNQTMGLGFYEYFLFCEDIGTKPLPILSGGYNPHTHQAASGEALKDFIHDALDLIEFANGGTDTVWGRKREEMGHPASFNMEYIGIGNEEVGEEFFERYPLFHKAIKEKYPEIKIIGTSGPFAAGREYDRGWKSATVEGSDLVDEHYYQSPEWFLSNHHRYDSFPENGPKVFLGEYASQDNTWFNALAEASYMVGMQNAVHAVKLACYAPLFCNVDYVNWKPDMIWFNNHEVLLTPNYHVQKLFMNHQGDALLEQAIVNQESKVMLSRFPDSLPGDIILEANDSDVVYSKIVITNEDSHAQYTYPKFNLTPDKPRETLQTLDCRNYTIRLNAQELSGKKGFVINFGYQDDKNRIFWRIGGWANEDSIIGEDVEGRNSCLIQKARNVEVGRTYELEIRVRGRKVETFVDGEKEQEVEVLPVVVEPIYVSGSLDRTTGDVIIKMVNVLPEEHHVKIRLQGKENSRWLGKKYKMEGFQKNDRNTFEKPECVCPEESNVAFDKGIFDIIMKPESICILRLCQQPQ